jgi:hypothetical protein
MEQADRKGSQAQVYRVTLLRVEYILASLKGYTAGDISLDRDEALLYEKASSLR